MMNAGLQKHIKNLDISPTFAIQSFRKASRSTVNYLYAFELDACSMRRLCVNIGSVVQGDLVPRAILLMTPRPWFYGEIN